MPTRPKTVDNMTKHQTKAEKAAREQAETEVLPVRKEVKLKKPKYVTDDKTANKYWNAIIKRMEDISLLDDLDSEVLGVYCSMLSRRDAVQQLMAAAQACVDSKDKSDQDKADAMAQIDSQMIKLQSLERSILSYADKLGLTPSGRVHLARKRAARAAEVPDEEADLFGDS